MSQPNPGPEHHKVLIVGGGTGGIVVAARLRRAGIDDVTVVEPSSSHYYQPLWTLGGGGRCPASVTVRPEADVMPKGVTWVHEAAAGADPAAQTVTTQSGRTLHYDYLVMAPGIQLDFDKVPGLTEALGQRGVSSNYRFDLAPRTWEFIRDLRGGTALFTMPAGPIKCAGAPQKIAYLAADWWRSQGVLARTRAVIADPKAGTKETIDYDILHATPPQSAPDWVKATPLADPASPFGYVRVDKHTLQSPDWPNVFALGDASSLPTSKTGAAIRKQAPILAANLLAAMHGQPLSGHYNGYTSCPLVTSRNRMLLAEFDYDFKRTPSIPLINTLKPRYDMWLLKRYGLPALYWNLMVKGLA